MKCKCSLNNNYGIIGIYDIKKFNEKISQFSSKSWTQITIPEKSSIPNNKPSIQNLTEIYLDIKITSTKIINQPISTTPSIEGLKLTGKALLVSGELHQNIIYISNTISNSIHSIKFNTPFNTYIVIEEDTDLENSSYDIYPFIEYVFVKPLDERTLIRSITLFLFAHKTAESSVLPTIEKLPNVFIFNNSNNQEVAKIEFNKTNMELTVTSTGIFYNAVGVQDAFRFELLDSHKISKVFEVIHSNTNADNFKSTLNGFNFQYGDLINLSFLDSSKVTLSNYPQIGNTYKMLTKLNQSFKITEDEIVSYALKNQIILNNPSKEPIVIIQFDILNERFLINSTEKSTDSVSNLNYFKMSLYESDRVTLKQTASIPENSTANDFKNIFINQQFKFGDIIKLEYTENDKVLITNFVDLGSNFYNPKGSEEWFKISQNGLFSINLSQILISFKGAENNEIATVQFNSFSKRLIVLSTGDEANSQFSNQEYFKLIIKSANGTIKLEASVKGNENANIFSRNLNNKPFEYGDIINLTYKERDRIEIFNYHAEGEVFSPFLEEDTFKITENGLEPEYTFLENSITFIGENNTLISQLRFNTNLKTLSVGSSKIQSNKLFENEEYFALVLKSFDGSIKKEVIVKGNETAENFSKALNNTTFEYGNIITLRYKEPNRVLIYNYHIDNEIFNPFLEEDNFTITASGLRPTYQHLENVIYFKGIINDLISIIRFNTTLKTLSVGNSKNKANNNFGIQEYFAFLLINENNKIIVQSSVKGNETAENFKTALNNKNFSYNDIIIIRYRESNKVLISNPNINTEIFNPPNKIKAFKISKEGLKSITPPPILTLANDFILVNSHNEEMLKVEFDIVNKKLIAIATDAIETSESSTFILLSFKISTINSIDLKFGENAKKIASQINTAFFDFGDILYISYFNKFHNLFKITNYPNIGETFIFPPPNTGFVRFKINATGLIRVN